MAVPEPATDIPPAAVRGADLERHPAAAGALAARRTERRRRRLGEAAAGAWLFQAVLSLSRSFGLEHQRPDAWPQSCRLAADPFPEAMQYGRMLSVVVALLGSCMAYKSRSINSIDAEDAGNPIRKVVSMMEKMGKKIEEEGKHEEDLYDKFKCYCKKTIGELEASIQQQEYNPAAGLLTSVM